MNFTNKKVLIIGGSSGIGRGIANCFLSLEAEVCITGTKASLSKYDVDDPVSEKCNYLQLNLLEDISLDNFILPFETLNILICSQGTVKYGRKEFELDVFREVLDVN